MRLTRKTLCIAGSALVILLTLLIVMARAIILSDFVDLEAELARENAHRLAMAIDSDARGLARTLGDWCAWDDTLDFIAGGNPGYIGDNLIPETFANLDLQLLLIADTERRIVWGGVHGRESGILETLASDLVGYLLDQDVLWMHASAASRTAGLLRSPMGNLLVASGPIVNSYGEGTIGGTMIMARVLDRQAVETLAARVQLTLSMRSVDRSASDEPQEIHALEYIQYQPITLTPVNAKLLHAALVLTDLQGAPVLEAQVSMPRNVYAQGRRTIRYFLLWLGGSGVAVILLALFFLRQSVIEPIARLNTQVAAIAKRSAFSERLTVAGHDEVGELSRGINTMLEALDAANRRMHQAYDQLRETQARLIQAAKLASIGELAAGVAHELNQPLMVIRGAGQLLARSLREETMDQVSLTDIQDMLQRNTHRMMRIIDHLGTFSRQSNRQWELVDINRILADCTLLIGEQLQNLGITVAWHLAESLPRIRGDQNQLEQVFINLILNARDAIALAAAKGADKEPGLIRIETSAVMEPDAIIEVRITDNGPGIPSEDRDKVFDPFFTTKEVGQGTGLGLSIGYGIVQDMGGELMIADTGPGGTTMVVRLPLSPSEVGDRDGSDASKGGG